MVRVAAAVLAILALSCAATPVVLGHDSELGEEIGQACHPPKLDCANVAAALARAGVAYDRYLVKSRSGYGTLETWLEAHAAFLQAEQSLRSVWCSCAGSTAAGRALVKTGVALEHFAEALRKIPVPPSVPAQHRQLYRDALAPGEEPGGWVVRKALEAYAAGLAIGERSAPDARWVALARERLAVVKGRRPPVPLR
jgi:hypothetical protein